MNWNSNFHATDAQLGMPQAHAADDLRIVANDCPLPNVIRTLKAAEDGRLARGFFALGHRGCLLYFLAGVRSKDELLAHPFDDAAGFAARRVVRFWDNGRLELPQIIQVLKDHVA